MLAELDALKKRRSQRQNESEEEKEPQNRAPATFILRQGARNVTDLSKARLISEPTRLAWQECCCEIESMTGVKVFKMLGLGAK
jgi:hypothetical protein